jgi:hypothetical protein
MLALRVNERTIRSDIQHYANYNTCYSVWLSKVDALCTRLLNVDLMQLIDSEGLDPIEYYENNVHPDLYFAGVVVPTIESDHGGDLIDEVIGLAAMWGNKQP